MIQKSDNQFVNQKQNAEFHNFPFCKIMKVSFGRAIYLIGSIQALGQWDLVKAIRLSCYKESIWHSFVKIPINQSIQYKYFISDYDKMDRNSIQWIDNVNQHLHLHSNLQQRKKQLTLMSFNIRYQNQGDKGENSWRNRRQNCIKIIRQKLPCCVGVQQARRTQKEYMLQKLNSIYHYVGIPRDGKDDEQCGIFIRKDRYAIIQHQFVWLSESREKFSIGYDSYFPRYCTFAVLVNLQDQFMEESNFIVVANLHLDQLGKLARKNSIQIILDVFRRFKKQYNNIADCFLMGDFNSQQDDQIFDILKVDQDFRFRSLRKVSLQTSTLPTFNGFDQTESKTFNEYSKIDHIFGSLQFYRPILFDVVISAQIASDHNPIYAQLQQKQID